MPEFKEDEDFKFPDEIDEKDDKSVEIEAQGDDVTIEIEDDTPPEDRNVEPLPDDMKQELESADEDDDYSQRVKKKFTQYKKAWHDERRAKEAALREQQEALELAKRLMAENERIKKMLQSGEEEYKEAKKDSAQAKLQSAKQAYKNAYEAGDEIGRAHV